MLEVEHWCMVQCMHSCHSTWTPPLRFLMWWSPLSNTQSLMTQTKPADEMTVGYGGLCSSRDGSRVGAGEVQEKVWASGWRCQLA